MAGGDARLVRPRLEANDDQAVAADSAESMMIDAVESQPPTTAQPALAPPPTTTQPQPPTTAQPQTAPHAVLTDDPQVPGITVPWLTRPGKSSGVAIRFDS